VRAWALTRSRRNGRDRTIDTEVGTSLLGRALGGAGSTPQRCTADGVRCCLAQPPCTKPPPKAPQESEMKQPASGSGRMAGCPSSSKSSGVVLGRRLASRSGTPHTFRWRFQFTPVPCRRKGIRDGQGNLAGHLRAPAAFLAPAPALRALRIVPLRGLDPAGLIPSVAQPSMSWCSPPGALRRLRAA
jgi:hypothetical protein